MTNYKRGDIVLVDFGFTAGIGSKKRPALIISTDSYHRSRQEVIVTGITSNIKRVLFGDTKIDQWQEAGLLRPSLVAGIIRTTKSNLILRKLGALSKRDLQNAQENLRKTMGL